VHAARVISTIDAHAGGEPLRIVTGGLPPLPGDTVLDRRQYLMVHHDDLRRFLLLEPRGHVDMYGAILTPPDNAEADYGVIFMTNEGYSTMCGHGIIALTTALLETGAIAKAEPSTQLAYDTPAGRIIARATVSGGKVVNVAFHNVPAFRYAADIDIQIANRILTVDVAWGGAFYALVDARHLGVNMTVENVPQLTELGMAVKRAVAVAIDARHPSDARLSGLYGTIISGPPTNPACHGQNITIYANGAVDRSPCGTGTSAKLAVFHETGQFGMNEPYLHESIIGTIFEGRITGQTSVEGHPAVMTEISGRGFLTGFHQFLLDPDDPTAPGFFIR
jgi:proline racemase